MKRMKAESKNSFGGRGISSGHLSNENTLWLCGRSETSWMSWPTGVASLQVSAMFCSHWLVMASD